MKLTQPSIGALAGGEMAWAYECKHGSSWVTVVQLEFHHIMLDPDASDDLQFSAPFPSDAVLIPNDSRSGFLVWLDDGSPVHARWCNLAKEFKRMGDDKVIDRAIVKAWAALPFPVARGAYIEKAD